MHRSRVFLSFLVIVAVLAIGEFRQQTAHAATTRVWTGAVDLNWGTAGNWNPSGVPVDGDSVLISSPAAGKTLNNNRPNLTLASMAFGDGMTISGNALGISNSIQVGSANTDVVLNLPLTLTNDAQVVVATGGRLFIRERLLPVGAPGLAIGGHTLTKTGPGQVEFNGDLTGTGTVAVQSGMVTFLAPVTFGGIISLAPGTRALMSDLPFVGGHCGSAPNTTFALNNAQFSAVCVVSIRAITGTGQLEMFSQNSRLFIAGLGSGATFNGTITGAAPSNIICCSNGGQTFIGTSSYTGGFFINSGAAYFKGATFPATSQFTIQGDAPFRAAMVGYGTFGETILTGGVLGLQAIDGAFGLARFPSLQFAPDVLVDFEVKGSVPGTGFTQIVMTGQVVLDSSILLLEFGNYAPAVGQSFTLVKGATALLDTFRNFYGGANLTEGATFIVPGAVSDTPATNLKFSITYKGGAGHDVVITRLASAPPPAPTYKRFLPMVSRD